MKKVVSVLSLCALFAGSVEGASEERLTVVANVEAVLEIARDGEGDIDLLGNEDARTANFTTKCNSANSTRVTLASVNAGPGGNFNVKSAENNRIEYTVAPNGGAALDTPREFEIVSGADVRLVFAPVGDKESYKAGEYTDTVTVTVAPVV